MMFDRDFFFIDKCRDKNNKNSKDSRLINLLKSEEKREEEKLQFFFIPFSFFI